MMVVFEKVLNTAKLPKRQTEGSAGYDLYAAERIVIPANGRALVGTGLRMQMPWRWEAQIRPRSGLAIRDGITVLNAPGTIDCDYPGEIKVILQNTTNQDLCVKVGDRIAQMVFAPTHTLPIVWGKVEHGGERQGGFGSTGR